MQHPSNYINEFKNRWRFRLWLVIALYVLSGAISIFLISKKLWVAALMFLIVLFVFYLIKKPNRISKISAIRFADKNLKQTTYSTGLLIKEYDELSRLEQIQYQNVQKVIATQLKKLNPPVSFKVPLIIAILLIAGGVVAHLYLNLNLDTTKNAKNTEELLLSFTTGDSLGNTMDKPTIKEQYLILNYPDYTGLPTDTVRKFDIEVIEGTLAKWNLRFDKKPDSLTYESTNEEKRLKQNSGVFTFEKKLWNSDFYSFSFLKDTIKFSSELHSIQIIQDEKPSIDIKNLDQFNTFDSQGNLNLQFTTFLEDDFGLNTAQIIATVSKGSGESVKFREEKLNFDTTPRRGSKRQKLIKNLNLELLDMEPGDELYFYVEVTDQKTPVPNVSRSETYFAKIKDTLTDVFAVEGAMAVDLMPDYFRSQRQLIIDTEKLIKERSRILKTEFNNRSNNLGYDQKALRIKYGQFMGDEAELEAEGGQIQDSHDNEDENENVLDEYTHKHDTENEHNLVEDDHDHDHEEENQSDEEEQDPLEAYLHNHDDPEESTLFTKSLKSKLREALSQMWDAELQLRLYEPKKSLPYQYKALKLIQEIKNSARIYVHRIGFDPPPIKEDTRLSGDLKNVKTVRERTTQTDEELYPFIKIAVQILPQFPIDKGFIENEKQHFIYNNAGSELAQIAIDQPGLYLDALQILKKITERKTINAEELNVLKKALYQAAPLKTEQLAPDDLMMTPLNTKYIETLKANG